MTEVAACSLAFSMATKLLEPEEFASPRQRPVRLWLLRDYRGLGLGREITAHLLRFARNTSWSRLRLDTSLRCTAAVGLFRKIGFREIHPYKESIGDCFMELDLTRRFDHAHDQPADKNQAPSDAPHFSTRSSSGALRSDTLLNPSHGQTRRSR